MKKRWKLVAITALLALICWCGWYARPVGVETLFPDLDPDMADVVLIQFHGKSSDSRGLLFHAGTAEYDAFWSQIEALRFHRYPWNPLIQAFPFLENLTSSSKTVVEDDINQMVIGFAQDNGQTVWQSDELFFFVDEWHYKDHSRGVSLPLLMKNSKDVGQKLAHVLWEQASE